MTEDKTRNTSTSAGRKTTAVLFGYGSKFRWRFMEREYFEALMKHSDNPHKQRVAGILHRSAQLVAEAQTQAEATAKELAELISD